ncbi:hypothetical protein N8I77_002786 [Diaporthe amygdali]|uniref:Uncharacterized protein n=1 Tax=Phomopsis amygdali TaxID=1214568 RepID=A0AAD9SU13_PHOAM|nr:hypothetical protein N8I77_002786 [Diaporthe amygdali]
MEESIVSAYTEHDEEQSWRYDIDKYTDCDFECFKCILRLIQALLRREPEKRISAWEAAGLIELTDHRRRKFEDPDEHGSESGQGDQEDEEYSID